MSDTIIRVENLGKKYLIRHQQKERYVALRDVLSKGAHRVKDKILGKGKDACLEQENFWALKNVSFEIKRGDRVGIIGRNGAGKSTLLKILSRITEPTTGFVELKGRVASLLEVGTGFHPELTGRENIYLNGAVLGMKKTEIRRKFDEIVAFSDVERFLDTPVKRYSSGMYVRLAFSVAAHLEPEILVVDEVLAVGDAAFQKKCMGKLKDAAEGEGRTVIFVSHNMSAINSLCTQGFMLFNGSLKSKGRVNDVVNAYLEEVEETLNTYSTTSRTLEDCRFGIKKVKILSDIGENFVEIGGAVKVLIYYSSSLSSLTNATVGFGLHKQDGTLMACHYSDYDAVSFSLTNREGIIECNIQKLLLGQGKYYFRFRCLENGSETDFPKDYLAHIEVLEGDFYQGSTREHGGPGILPIRAEWSIK